MRKLQPTKIGPLTVIEVDTSLENYKLDLLYKYRYLHNTLHTNLLTPFIPNNDQEFPMRRRTQPGPIPDIEGEQHLYNVKLIHNRRYNNKTKCFEYLIEWDSYTREHDMWLRRHDIDASLVDAFDKEHPFLKNIQKKKNKGKKRH